MRKSTRIKVTCLVLVALVAASPLTAAPRPTPETGAPAAAVSGTPSLRDQLSRILDWLQALVESGLLSTGPASSKAPSSLDPASPSSSNPGPGVSPQSGPIIEPNG